MASNYEGVAIQADAKDVVVIDSASGGSDRQHHYLTSKVNINPLLLLDNKSNNNASLPTLGGPTGAF